MQEIKGSKKGKPYFQDRDTLILQMNSDLNLFDTLVADSDSEVFTDLEFDTSEETFELEALQCQQHLHIFEDIVEAIMDLFFARRLVQALLIVNDGVHLTAHIQKQLLHLLLSHDDPANVKVVYVLDFPNFDKDLLEYLQDSSKLGGVLQLGKNLLSYAAAAKTWHCSSRGKNHAGRGCELGDRMAASSEEE